MARPTILIGPPVAQMTREAAAEALKSNPKLPKDAEVEIQQHAGHWIAAFLPDQKTAAPFGPADDSEESAGPKSEGPDDSGPSDDGGGPPDDGGSDDGGEDGAPKKKHEGGGLEQVVHQLMQTVDAIATALGVPPAGAGAGLGPDSLDAGGPGGPPGGPPGMGGPPPPPPHGHGGPPGLGGPPGGAPPMPQKVMHEKAGPPPPATFANVAKQADRAMHPWGHMVGQVSHFTVASEIGEDSYETVEQELQDLAKKGGFRVARFTPLVGQQGERAVQAVIETPRSA